MLYSAAMPLDLAHRYRVVAAGPLSRPIVARHGFEPLTTAQSFEPPAAPAA